MSRREELRHHLDAVRERIAAACAVAGRRPEEVTLVTVTKNFPGSDIDLLADLGVTAIGESKDQEAAAKFSDEGRRARVEVHFVGQLQSNKADSVAGYADVVHSVDRPKVVGALAKGAARAGRPLTALVQVDLGEATGRGGVDPSRAVDLADEVAASGLALGGVMAVAPLHGDPARAFGRLREVSEDVRRRHPEAIWVSAGMSGDLEAAILHGATHLRVGSAILGSRPPLR